MENEAIIRAVVFMIGADGEYDPREMAFLNNLCTQLELPRKCVVDAFKGITGGKTTIRIPEDPETRSRIMDHLIDAALSDGRITDREQQVLEKVGKKMGIGRPEIGRRIGGRHRPAEPDVDLAALTADDLVDGPGKSAAKRVLARCPKCAYEAVDPEDPLIRGPHGSGECPFCGIIVDKYKRAERGGD